MLFDSRIQQNGHVSEKLDRCVRKKGHVSGILDTSGILDSRDMLFVENTHTRVSLYAGKRIRGDAEIGAIARPHSNQ